VLSIWAEYRSSWHLVIALSPSVDG
jgi:hypothetical protein